MTPPVFVGSAAELAAARPGLVVRLGGPEARHARTVRRMREGEPVDLVDGAGRRVHGRLASSSEPDVLVVVVDAVLDEPPPAPHLTVVQALPKGDRSELAVELLTEIGADTIVPWAAARCVAVWRGDKAERGAARWSAVAAAAGKQSRRARFPVVAPMARTAAVQRLLGAADLGLVLHEAADLPLADVALPDRGGIVLVVGPEGGLADEELSALTGSGAQAVRLGPTVLRTSTAGAAALAVLQARTGRWGGPIR